VRGEKRAARATNLGKNRGNAAKKNTNVVVLTGGGRGCEQVEKKCAKKKRIPRKKGGTTLNLREAIRTRGEICRVGLHL